MIAADETLEACVDAVEHACRIPRDRPALVVAPDRAAARRLHGKLAGRLRDRPVEPDLWPTRLPGKDAAAGRYARVRRAVVTAAGCGAAGASNVPYGAVVHSAAGAAVTRAAVTGAAGACRVRGAPVLAVVTPGGIGGPGERVPPRRPRRAGPVGHDRLPRTHGLDRVSNSFSPYTPGRGGRAELDAERLCLAHAAAVAGDAAGACTHALHRAAGAWLLLDRVDAVAAAAKKPGPDGVRPADLDGPERRTLARRLSDLMTNPTGDDRYVAGPTRAAAIPKASGGTRRLHVPNQVDTVVHGALADAVRAATPGTLSVCPRSPWGTLPRCLRERGGRRAARLRERRCSPACGRRCTLAACTTGNSPPFRDFPDRPPAGSTAPAAGGGPGGPRRRRPRRGPARADVADRGRDDGGGAAAGVAALPAAADAFLTCHLDGPLAAAGAAVVRYADDCWRSAGTGDTPGSCWRPPRGC